MDTTKVVFFLIALHSSHLLCRYTDSSPINFEFSHHEVLVISDTEDDVQEYDYYDDSSSDALPVEQDSGHIRKRRSVKWMPNYDLYEQWVEEYYAQNEEESKGKPENLIKPKNNLLDRLISATQNKTQEEIESERKEEKQRKEVLRNTLQYGSWTFGIVMIFFFALTLFKRFWRKITCDFCDVFNYRAKIKHMLTNLTPGVYVLKDGSKKHYKPTTEEIEALKDIQKILFSLS